MAIKYRHVTWTGDDGKRRRSFAKLIRKGQFSGKDVIVLELLRNDGDSKHDDKQELLMGFTDEIVIREARMNLHYGKLEIVK